MGGRDRPLPMSPTMRSPPLRATYNFDQPMYGSRRSWGTVTGQRELGSQVVGYETVPVYENVVEVEREYEREVPVPYEVEVPVPYEVLDADDGSGNKRVRHYMMREEHGAS